MLYLIINMVMEQVDDAIDYPVEFFYSLSAPVLPLHKIDFKKQVTNNSAVIFKPTKAMQQYPT